MCVHVHRQFPLSSVCSTYDKGNLHFPTNAHPCLSGFCIQVSEYLYAALQANGNWCCDANYPQLIVSKQISTSRLRCCRLWGHLCQLDVQQSADHFIRDHGTPLDGIAHAVACAFDLEDRWGLPCDVVDSYSGMTSRLLGRGRAPMCVWLGDYRASI